LITERPYGKSRHKEKAKKPDKKEQYERFQQTARELGVEDEKSAEAFERVFVKIVQPRKRKS
jgi:hypothetical protein